MNDGVEVRSYLHWSRLDNWEWGQWGPPSVWSPSIAQASGEVGRVASEITKRIGESDGAESLALQGADLGVEAGGVGPRAVDEHDGRGVSGHCRHDSFSTGFAGAKKSMSSCVTRWAWS
jgi:hypothetical protein